MKAKLLGLQGVFRHFAIGFISYCLCSAFVYADTPSVSVDNLLIEAKCKCLEGDHEGAAKAYSQILDVDVNHREAQVGLAEVLMKAQLEAHHSDESDALKAIQEKKAQQMGAKSSQKLDTLVE